MRVLSPELSPAQLQHSMEIFGNLIPARHSQLYATIVSKAVQFHSAAAASAPRTAAPVVTLQQKPRTAPSALAAVLSTDTAQESRASKRAKMMLSSASTSQQVHASSAKSLLSTVDGISLSRPPHPGPASATNPAQQQLKRLACIICKESPPREACASPCGHICCQKCWADWLKVKAECPMCRVRTAPSDIARIRVA
jgi:hypothetical protein